METIIFLLVIVAYILAAYYTIRFISKRTAHFKLFPQIVIRSFFFSLLFGIGILASGGDPGFGFPVPNLIVIIMSIYFDYTYDYNRIIGDIFFILLWWILAFIFMMVKSYLNNQNKFTDIN